jgi:alkylhydroperoxidase family enzyme
LEPRARIAARYAAALTQTPVRVGDELAQALRATFTPREIVVLAATIAQVNTWARFNHGLEVPAAGFFDAASCPVALPTAPAREPRSS